MEGDIKQQALDYLRDESEKPLSVNELEETLELSDADGFKALMKALNELEDNGQVIRTRSNRYGVPEKMNLLRGKIQAHAKGFAFLIPDEGDVYDDVYIPQGELNGAMNKDIVLIRVNQDAKGGGRPEGTVVRIVERGNSKVVGTYDDNNHFGFVIPDDQKIPSDIFIPKNSINGAVDGHKVVVEITKYPEGRKNAEGAIVHILGHKNDPGIDILSIIHKHGIPTDFPDEVMDEAKAAPSEIDPAEIEGRRDLRDETIVTIDGADAKDLDDAVHVVKLDNGNYKLGVHIADVTYYVEEDSALDKEAYERGNSTYLVDRVIPMIPHRLSNGICSLNPNVDRLTLSCEMEITPEGQVIDHDIFPSVINTTERMTYTDVRKILLKEDDEVIERYKTLVPFFETMGELANILTEKRRLRGAVDFDFKEAKVLVDDEGHPTDVALRERSVAERLIEEFMLAANETVAEHFHWMDLPFIYRIHEEPNPDKLSTFYNFAVNFGYVVKGSLESIHPRTLQALLEEVKDEPEEPIISTVMLRSMQQAKYYEESLGHFGLATDFYTHFTSPIRRYPDLIVHRLIRKYLIEKRQDASVQKHWANKLPDIAQHSSETERRSVDAERETDDLKKAEFMKDQVGETFDGMISGVTSFGLFVELPNTIEGLVHISYLTDDYYHYSQEHMALIGERTGNVFRIGDEVTVQVMSVSTEERRIDFEISGMQKPERTRKARPKVITDKHSGANDKKKKDKKKKGKDQPFYEGAKRKKKRKK